MKLLILFLLIATAAFAHDDSPTHHLRHRQIRGERSLVAGPKRRPLTSQHMKKAGKKSKYTGGLKNDDEDTNVDFCADGSSPDPSDCEDVDACIYTSCQSGYDCVNDYCSCTASCVKACESNMECDSNQKCIDDVCTPINLSNGDEKKCESVLECDPGRQCTNGVCIIPVTTKGPGICQDGNPPDVNRCRYDPCIAATCLAGLQCVGNFCDCSHDCVEPEETPCTTSMDCESFQQCIDDICVVPEPGCGISADCGAGEYCANYRKCLPLGICRDADDCLNRDNFSPNDACETEVTAACDDDGKCSYGCKPEGYCASSEHCGSSGFCAGGKCAPHGNCRVDADCFNPSNELPPPEKLAGEQCKEYGYLYCDTESGRCARECDAGPCPKGVSQVNCFAAPCQVTRCGGECVDNYCGGCNAIIFTPTGEQVCGSGVYPKPCRGSCVEGEEYCSVAGICLPFQECRANEDCENEDNAISFIGCKGEISCESGKCTKRCDTVEECSLLDSCEEAASCVVDKETGEVFFYSAIGEQVCVETEQECENSSDCKKGKEYCSEGKNCLSFAKCNVIADCTNPDNEVAFILCVGDLSCKGGECHVDCT